ncbi:MAG: hypothetical protein ACW990_00230 [Promethearchaeota archaeon]|jgi:hypothetical protein
MITKDDFKKIEITSLMRENAERRAIKMGVLNNSHTMGKGNIAGFLGEEIVLDYYKGASLEDTYDYDINIGVYTFDIKSKHVHTEPEPSMDATVYSGSIIQNSFGYIFTRIFFDGDDYIYGWILGWISKKRFLREAIEHRKGEIDPSNNYEYIGDCYNIPIEILGRAERLEYFLPILKTKPLGSFLNE